jgi:hypothetical protein
MRTAASEADVSGTRAKRSAASRARGRIGVYFMITRGEAGLAFLKI